LPWRESNIQELITVSQALVKNNIRRCGQYQIRFSMFGDGDYLIGCTRDGQNWTYYTVQISSQEVKPITDPTITAPFQE
jgi:hypothetical protein